MNAGLSSSLPRSLRRPRPAASRAGLGGSLAAALAGLALVFGATPSSAQVVVGPTDTTTVVADPGDVAGEARAAQAMFERRRLRLLPLSLGGSAGPCDEHVGRFCTWYGEGEWYPVPEDARITEMRADLLAQLDSLQRFAPGDEWILGQRVWYRSEGEMWSEALSTARRCGEADPEWCAALQGFALHGLGRYAEALAAFERALSTMDPGTAREWRLPRWPVDSEVRDLLEDAEGDPEAEEAVLDRLWLLADPLYLVDGNDRLTAHYSRWTVAALRDRARNPFRIRWGPDLDQLTVRHGWELGWERTASWDYSSVDHVVGHKHPEARDYMPPGRAVADPARAEAEDLRPDRDRPRSLYAPKYAPVLLPMEAQIALFPRGESTLIVASPFLPDDTTYHTDHGHALPWMEAGSQAHMPDRVGLFAVSLDGRGSFDASHYGAADGALVLEVPTGAYVVSVESWSPARRRAGRQRMGVLARAAPADIATLSQIVLLNPSGPEPGTLEAAAESMLPRARIYPGQTFAIGWEVVGLGFHPEVLGYEVSVRRTDRGVLRRLGEFLRLADRPQPLALSWDEPGPAAPGHVFRYLNLDLPALEPGEYEIQLILETVNRSDAVVTKAFEVIARGD